MQSYSHFQSFEPSTLEHILFLLIDDLPNTQSNMARLSLSLLAVFLVMAAFALSMPTKRDSTHGLSLDTALEDLKVCDFNGPHLMLSLANMFIKGVTKFMQGFDNKQSNDQNNEHKIADAANIDSAKDAQKSDKKDKNQPTPTSKKPTSGNFVTPTATNTHHPTSTPNMLGKLPLIGGLLGGTGGPL